MVAVAHKQQTALNFPPAEALGLDRVMELFGHFMAEARSSDSLLYEIAAWHLALKGLQMIEDFMKLPPSVDALEGHRCFVDAALTHGRMILERVQNTEDPMTACGADASHVRSNLEWLENKRAMWHQQMNPEREADILSIFGEATGAK